MLTMDPDMVDALCFSYRLGITCTPQTYDEYGDPTPGDPLDVVGGSVHQDTEPPVRRNAALTLAVPALSTPAEVQALAESLVADGTLLQLAWTVTLMDKRTWTVPVGLLRAESAEWSMSTGQITVRALDMGQAVVDDRFITPRALSGGTKAEAVEDLLTETVAWSAVTVGGSVPTTSLSPVTFDVDRDKAVTELATSLGCWWWWGEEGGWRLDVIPTPATSPADWTLPVSPVDADGNATREGAYNAVIVTGQTPTGDTDPTPFGDAYDTNPASPTYWDGPFGHKPMFYSSPVLTTDAQCEAAAASLLAQRVGITRGFRVQVPPNPGLEPGDTIEFAGGVPAGVYAVDSIDLPLDGTAMTIEGRRVA